MSKKIILSGIAFIALSASAPSFGMNTFFKSIGNYFAEKAKIYKQNLSKDIFKAIRIGDLKKLKKLIKKLDVLGINFNSLREGDPIRSPLHVACEGGYKSCKDPVKKLSIVAFLIEKGADVNARDMAGFNPCRYDDYNKGYGQTQGFTPLHLACAKGSLEIVQILLENGAGKLINEYVCDDYRMTPLDLACEQNTLEVVKLLLKNGAIVSKCALDIVTEYDMTETKRYFDLANQFNTSAIEFCKYHKISSNMRCWLKFDEQDKELCEFAKELQKSRCANKQSVFKEFGPESRLINSSDCRVRTVN